MPSSSLAVAAAAAVAALSAPSLAEARNHLSRTPPMG
jgi:hypothetical protein